MNPSVTRALIILWAVLTVALVTPDIMRYRVEQREIAAVAAELVRGCRTPREKAQAVSNGVRAHVQAVEQGSFYHIDHRPVFRHTAWQTWSHAEGGCSEGARLIALLLVSQGIRASRLELFAPPDYEHAVVAYLDGEQWYLVDSIASPDDFHAWITRLPRRFDANFSNPFFTSYTFFNWSRLTGRTLAFDQKRPFPTALVILTENPLLLAAVTKVAAISAIFGTLLLWSRRRRFKEHIA